MAELRQQRAREQRVDLVVLGDQDRQGPCARAAVSRSALGAVVGIDASDASSAPKRAASEAARTGFTR